MVLFSRMVAASLGAMALFLSAGGFATIGSKSAAALSLSDILDKITIDEGGVSLKPTVTLVGKGCPKSSAKGVMNGDVLAITYNRFVATAEAGEVTLKECLLNITVTVPKGKELKPLGLAYGGYAHVDSLGVATLKTLIGYNGNLQPIEVKTFSPGFSSDYIVEWPLNMESIKACSGSKRLQVITIGTALLATGVDSPVEIGIFNQRSGSNPNMSLKIGFSDCSDTVNR
jgi:hypothetical protein